LCWNKTWETWNHWKYDWKYLTFQRKWNQRYCWYLGLKRSYLSFRLRNAQTQWIVDHRSYWSSALSESIRIRYHTSQSSSRPCIIKFEVSTWWRQSSLKMAKAQKQYWGGVLKKDCTNNYSRASNKSWSSRKLITSSWSSNWVLRKP